MFANPDLSIFQDLMLGALEFRNEYATRPYLPEELISDDHRKVAS